MSDRRLSPLHEFVEHVHKGPHAKLESVGPLDLVQGSTDGAQ